jgi:hypothetical protein
MIITEEVIKQAIATLKQYEEAVEKREKCLIKWDVDDLITTTSYTSMLRPFSPIDEAEAIRRLEYLLAHPADYAGVKTENFPSSYWNKLATHQN